MKNPRIKGTKTVTKKKVNEKKKKEHHAAHD